MITITISQEPNSRMYKVHSSPGSSLDLLARKYAGAVSEAQRRQQDAGGEDKAVIIDQTQGGGSGS